MENLKQATSTVKMQAESLIEEMSIKLPILRSSNAESFCKILLPQLLKHHSSDIQTLELWQRGQQKGEDICTSRPAGMASEQALSIMARRGDQADGATATMTARTGQAS